LRDHRRLALARRCAGHRGVDRAAHETALAKGVEAVLDLANPSGNGRSAGIRRKPHIVELDDEGSHSGLGRAAALLTL